MSETKPQASGQLKELPNLEGLIRINEPGKPPNIVFVVVVNGDHGKDMEIESYIRFKILPRELKDAIHAALGIPKRDPEDLSFLGLQPR